MLWTVRVEEVNLFGGGRSDPDISSGDDWFGRFCHTRYNDGV